MDTILGIFKSGTPSIVWLLLVIPLIIYVRRQRRRRSRFDLEFWLAVILALPFGLFVLSAIGQTFPDKVNFPLPFDLEKSANVPNYLVFFATAISAYLLYITLNRQREANQIAAFENNYFKYIDYHRENVNQLRYRDPKTVEQKYWKGNQVFTIIYYEIRDLLDEYVKNAEFSTLNKEKRRKILNFLYLCVFYGAGEDGLASIRSMVPDHAEMFQRISFIGKRAKYEASDSDNDGTPSKYFSGHVRHLGQYYRNLYQAVRYVERQKFLTEDEKYNYITMLRAQMSVHEQLVFFFNALSELGAPWELEHYQKATPQKKREKRKLYKKLLITKYDFIRNLLNSQGTTLQGIRISEFFPLMTIERNEECGVSGVLPFKDNKQHICRFCFNEHFIECENEQAQEKINDYFTDENGKRKPFKCDEPRCAAMKKYTVPASPIQDKDQVQQPEKPQHPLKPNNPV